MEIFASLAELTQTKVFSACTLCRLLRLLEELLSVQTLTKQQGSISTR